MPPHGRTPPVEVDPAPGGRSNIASGHLPDELLGIINSAAAGARGVAGGHEPKAFLEVFSGISAEMQMMIDKRHAHELQIVAIESRDRFRTQLLGVALVIILILAAAGGAAILAAAGLAHAIAAYLAMFTTVSLGGGTFTVFLRWFASLPRKK